MNLLTEYRSRHNIPSIVAAPHTVLFLNGKPLVALLVSAPPRCLSICERCNGKGLILEGLICFINNGIKNILHHHIDDPDADILAQLPKILQSGKPVMLKTCEQMEEWAWKMFSNRNKIHHSPEEALSRNPVQFHKFMELYNNIFGTRTYMLHG